MIKETTLIKYLEEQQCLPWNGMAEYNLLAEMIGEIKRGELSVSLGICLGCGLTVLTNNLELCEKCAD